MPIEYSLLSHGDETFITVLDLATGELHPANSGHPNFKEIAGICIESKLPDADEVDVDYLVSLFDLTAAVERKFERLSDRVTVAHGRVYFDGDEIDTSLTTQIARFLEEGSDDWSPLVNFFEKVMTNPQEHSRDQLFDWLRVRDGISITPEGNIVGYKGVHSDGNGGYVSGFAGTAIVDGEEITGKIPNAVGSTVEMPRSKVAHNPSQACSYGLHVGTYSYAQDYARGAMLAVEVDPRDVVSVPTDGGGEKIRVCRYQVKEIIEQAYTTAVVSFKIEMDYDEEYEDEFEDDEEIEDNLDVSF